MIVGTSGAQAVKQVMQFCLSVLRWLHIDLYAIMKRRAERGLWRRVWPSGGRLRDDGLCVAVDIQAFDSLAQVGRDFIDMIGRTEIPHSVFNLHIRYGDSVPFDDEFDILAPDFSSDSVPRIAWGKYSEQHGRLELTVSMEVNHRFIDGIHIEKFSGFLEKMIADLADQ